MAAGVLRAEAGPRPGLHVRECTTFTIDPDCALFLACANQIIHRHQGLHDRGTIEVGKRADLNLIDMQKLKIKHPEFIHDSTSGNDTPRWHQVSKAFRYLPAGVLPLRRRV